MYIELESNIADKIGQLIYDVFSRRSVLGATFAAFTAASASLVTKTSILDLANASVSFMDAITIASTSFVGFGGFMLGIGFVSDVLREAYWNKFKDHNRVLLISSICSALSTQVHYDGTIVENAPDLVAFGHQAGSHMILHGDHLYLVDSRNDLIKRLRISENESARSYLAMLREEDGI